MHKPDVMCLQETKVQDQDFPVDAFRDVGYQATFRGIKGYNGVATLNPPVQSHCALDNSEDSIFL